LAEHPEEEELEISNDKDDRKEERTSLPKFGEANSYLYLVHKSESHPPFSKTLGRLGASGAKAANVYKHTKHDMRKPLHSTGSNPRSIGFVGVGAEVSIRYNESRVYKG
jgi:hypothetical protein